jgi:hypothetical protein
MPPRLAAPSRNPTGSCRRDGEDLLNLRRALTILDALGQHTQPQGFHSCDSFVTRLAVRHGARDLRDFSNPAPISLFLSLDGKSHAAKDAASTQKHKVRTAPFLRSDSGRAARHRRDRHFTLPPTGLHGVHRSRGAARRQMRPHHGIRPRFRRRSRARRHRGNRRWPSARYSGFNHETRNVPRSHHAAVNLAVDVPPFGKAKLRSRRPNRSNEGSSDLLTVTLLVSLLAPAPTWVISSGLRFNKRDPRPGSTCRDFYISHSDRLPRDRPYICSQHDPIRFVAWEKCRHGSVIRIRRYYDADQVLSDSSPRSRSISCTTHHSSHLVLNSLARPFGL